MAKSLRDRFSEALISQGLVTESDLKRAHEIQLREGGNIASILIREGMVSEKDLISVMSTTFSIPTINLSKYKIEEDCVHLIPEKVARQYRLIAICKLADTLIVAVADPLNIFAVDDLRMLTRFNIEVVVSTENDILKAIDKYYPKESAALADIIKDAPESDLEVVNIPKEEFDITSATIEGESTPIVKIVDLILLEALKRRASDIHIEPTAKDVRVRYRIDGNMQDVLKIPKKNQNAVLARIKIMSGMDITEFRVPQDGRFKVKTKQKEVDFRVSALPTTFGNKIVLRALDKSNLSVGLDKLGFSEYALECFKEAIARPFGMLLVTGPTGSGKSTTLYSIVNQLNKPDENIITIEEPVEYQVDGLTQIPVKSEIGLTFANGLRSILRQSPDIIMIGEIRDSETADIAIKASLTGQLVFSTLHTNDSVTAISRLMDMGIEPFLIATSIILIAAQRLCRKLCRDCKGKGCSKCSSTGYYGRQAVLEVLTIDDRIREMIIDRISTDEIKKYAISKGMKTLRDDAMDKYKRGVTTMDEVTRVTQEE